MADEFKPRILKEPPAETLKKKSEDSNEYRIEDFVARVKFGRLTHYEMDDGRVVDLDANGDKILTGAEVTKTLAHPDVKITFDEGSKLGVLQRIAAVKEGEINSLAGIQKQMRNEDTTVEKKFTPKGELIGDFNNNKSISVGEKEFPAINDELKEQMEALFQQIDKKHEPTLAPPLKGKDASDPKHMKPGEDVKPPQTPPLPQPKEHKGQPILPRRNLPKAYV